jgi:hypothetical protein
VGRRLSAAIVASLIKIISRRDSRNLIFSTIFFSITIFPGPFKISSQNLQKPRKRRS